MNRLKTTNIEKPQRQRNWLKASVLLVALLVANCNTEHNFSPGNRPITITPAQHEKLLQQASTPPIRINTQAQRTLVLYEGCEGFDIANSIQNLFHLQRGTALELKYQTSTTAYLPFVGSANIQIQPGAEGPRLSRCQTGITSFEVAALVPGTSSPIATQALKLIVVPRPEDSQSPQDETDSQPDGLNSPQDDADSQPDDSSSQQDDTDSQLEVAENPPVDALSRESEATASEVADHHGSAATSEATSLVSASLATDTPHQNEDVVVTPAPALVLQQDLPHLDLNHYFSPPQAPQQLKLKKITANTIQIQLQWARPQSNSNLTHYKLTRCRGKKKTTCTNKQVVYLAPGVESYVDMASLLSLHITPLSSLNWQNQNDDADVSRSATPNQNNAMDASSGSGQGQGQGQGQDQDQGADQTAESQLLRLQNQSIIPLTLAENKSYYEHTQTVLGGQTYHYTLTSWAAMGESLHSAYKKIKAPRLRGHRPQSLNIETLPHQNTYITQISFEKPEALPAVNDYVLSTCTGSAEECEDPSLWTPLDVPLDESALRTPAAQNPGGGRNILRWLLPIGMGMLDGLYGRDGEASAPQQDRFVRVQARDAKGNFIGEPSKNLKLQKAIGTVARLTAVLSAREPKNQQALGVQLSWLPPANLESQANLSYSLQRAKCSECSQANWQNIEAVEAEALQHTDRFMLEPGQPYTYRLRAHLNRTQHGPWRYVQITLPALPPQPPSALTVARLNTDSVKVSWPAVADNGGAEIESYKLERSHTTDNWLTLKSNISADMRAYTDLGLLNPFVPGQKYTYRLSARNARGESDFVVSKALLWLTVPDEPTMLTVEPVQAEPLWPNDLGLSLKWQAPVNTGGTELTGYKLERCQGAVSLCAYGPWKEFKIKPTPDYIDQSDLKPATTYSYKISAVNSQGESEATAPVSRTTPVILPTEPVQFQAALQAQSHHLFWQVPVDSGGAKVIDYRVQVCVTQQDKNNPNCLPSNKKAWHEWRPAEVSLVEGQSRDSAQDEAAGEAALAARKQESSRQVYTTRLTAAELLDLMPGLSADVVRRVAVDALHQFYYRLAARNKRGVGPFSNRQVLQAPRAASAPQNLKAVRGAVGLSATGPGATGSSATGPSPADPSRASVVTLSWQVPQDLGWPFARRYELQECLDTSCSQTQAWRSVEAQRDGAVLKHSLAARSGVLCYRVRAVALISGLATLPSCLAQAVAP